jgi:hypothetical protein
MMVFPVTILHKYEQRDTKTLAMRFPDILMDGLPVRRLRVGIALEKSN